jgi:hypothetical protein
MFLSNKRKENIFITEPQRTLSGFNFVMQTVFNCEVPKCLKFVTFIIIIIIIIIIILARCQYERQ